LVWFKIVARLIITGFDDYFEANIIWGIQTKNQVLKEMTFIICAKIKIQRL